MKGTAHHRSKPGSNVNPRAASDNASKRITLAQRDHRDAQLRRHAMVETPHIAQPRYSNDDDDRGIEVALESIHLEPRVVHNFKTLVNMVQYIKRTLFSSGTEDHHTQAAVDQAKTACEETIRFFGALQRSFATQLNQISETHDYLPIVGGHIERHHLETHIKVWAEKVCE